jgi:hypothetical protein
VASPAAKDAAHRHVADASFHVTEAIGALRRARDRTGNRAVHDALDRLVRGQDSTRRILGRVREHLTRGQA